MLASGPMPSLRLKDSENSIGSSAKVHVASCTRFLLDLGGSEVESYVVGALEEGFLSFICSGEIVVSAAPSISSSIVSSSPSGTT